MSEAEQFVTVAITVRGADGVPLEGAQSTLKLDTWENPFAASGWRPAFSIPASRLGNGGDMTVEAAGYETRTARVITPFPEDNLGIRVANAASEQKPTAREAYDVMDQEFIVQFEGTDPVDPVDPVDPPSPIDLLPIWVDGKWFRTSDGVPWTQIGCSDFRLLERFLRGEDIGQVLAERANIGFNQLRVFAMCDLMFHLYPQEHADYPQRLRQFLEIVADYGLRVELTVLVDATRVMPDTGSQQIFFNQVVDVVRGMPHVFLELVNENDQTINRINPDAFSQPEGIISSHGSKGVVDAAAEPVCVTPIWSYGTLHPSRPPDWPRLGGHNTMEDVSDKHGTAGTDNESCRPDQGRGPIPSDWFDAAGNIALLCAGGTMHSQCGKDSRPFDATERPCAEAWVKGAKVVSLDYQRGAYIAGHLSGYPINWAPGDSARAHGRLVGNRACCSLPQMRDGYTPTARPGWRITKQNGSIVELEGTARAALDLMKQHTAMTSTAD
jgi:hypothetical protein